MSFLCPDCPTDNISPSYSDNCELITRPFGSAQFILFKCDIEFTDITDLDEWTAKITAGEIIVSPIGNFQIGEIASEIAFTEGCGREIRDISSVPFTYETPRVAENYEDEQWYTELDLLQQSYNLGYIDCNACRLHLPFKQVKEINTPTVNVSGIGFDFSLNTVPQFVEGAGGAGKSGLWRAQGTFFTTTVINSVEITGLCSILNA
jgi:hypothetical protein